MLTFVGYIPLRRGLLQHIQEGRITLREYDVFTILLMWADHNSGIAVTNATGLVFLSGGQLDLQYCRQCLRSLEDKGYIKRPFYVQGQRGDQKIFIDKYVVTAPGKLSGKALSFALTTDWNDPQYEDISENQSGDQRSNNNKQSRIKKKEVGVPPPEGTTDQEQPQEFRFDED